MIQVMQDQNLNVKKDELELQKETLKDIVELANLISGVESQQDVMKDKFKKDLNQMIPKLDSDINELFEECQAGKFLDGEKMGQIEEIIIELEALEERFKKNDETATKYNSWQETLET